MQQYALLPRERVGPGAYNRDTVVIDEHTGTQWDAPAHFVPPPDSGLPNAGPAGLLTSDKVPAAQLAGEACVIDVSDHVDDAAAGASYLITKDHVAAWEKAHRELGRGDVVLFRSGYSDRYYRPFPAGRRFVHTALRKESPGWPAPAPECLEHLASKGVMAAGIDSPSMGPLPDLAAATHLAGGRHGMIWTEGARGLGALPATGAFYALLPAKHAGGSGGEARALAVTEPALAARLNASARAGRVAELSVLLDENHPVTWPGRGAGDDASIYVASTLHAFGQPRGAYFARGHMLDSHCGTHVVPPSFALPPRGAPARNGSKTVSSALAEYEPLFGPPGTSEVTVDALPPEHTMGRARVIDVRALLGSTTQEDWPASPLITLDRVRSYERDAGPIEAGDVVLFHSGYSDLHFKPFPEDNRMMAEPLAGTAEGWPAPEPQVLAYLAERGVRCVGTDGPALGGVDEHSALKVYWAAASRGLAVVEYLTNLGAIAGRDAYFIFAPVKLAGGHGGYGRAIALY
jgi:kynurenine formamidase